MRKLLPWLLATGFVSSLAWAQTREIEFTEFDLDNGLHVILHEDHSTPNVVVSVMYMVGSKDEDPTRTGFAHFFEHLLFEGSKNIKRGEFDRYINEAGGTNNANTTHDRTYYYEFLPSNYLELGLWLESERMLHADIKQVGVDTQREVVKEEYRQRYGNQPYMESLFTIWSTMFEKHPYRWAPIGSLEHLNQATLDEFMAFYEKFYVPNNAVLSIAGDLDVDEAKALVKKYFADIPAGKGEIKRDYPQEPERTAEKRAVDKDQVQLPAVLMGYGSPSVRNKDSYAFEMMFNVLATGESSRLSKSVKDNQELAVFVGGFPGQNLDPGYLIMFAVANMGVQVDTLEKAMTAEIEKLHHELITEEEFQKVRNQMENQFVTQNASLAGIAENLATNYAFRGDTNLINTQLELYMKVTREDIRDAAKKYLNSANRAVVHVVPDAQPAQN